VDRFGALSAAELKLVRASSHRELPWLGPSDDPDAPANDVTRGEHWGPERTVRAEIIRWLVADPEASRLVHSSGLAMGGARIAGALDLSYATFDKPITILSCYEPDKIDLRSAHLVEFIVRRSNTGPVPADSVNIAGDISFITGNYGSMSFFRARIRGNFDLSAARVMESGQDTVNLVEATVGGDAIFQDGFTTDGTVDVRLAKIGHDLSFHGVTFTGADNNGLNAERVIFDGTFYWTEIQHTKKTVLDLEDARAGAIWDDEASWPSPGNLVINGFIYNEIAGGLGDAADRLRWLGLQSPGYRPQPYRQLAKVLTDSGRENGATDVRVAKEIALRHFGNLSTMQRAWSIMLQLTIGFGYHPLRALWWIGAFVALGTALFGWGYRSGLITPTDERAYTAFVETAEAPPHYPSFNPFVYSLENFLPVVVLYQDQYWRPNARHSIRGRVRSASDPLDAHSLPSRLLRAYLWLHILAGWVITPLLFVGLSGLVRPD